MRMAGTGPRTGSDGFPTSAREAVSTLFHVHHRRLVGLASLLVDDHGTAEEIVQDAFESLYKRWDRLRDPHAAVAYLDRSVVYGARSWVRRRVTARSFTPPDAGVEVSAEHTAVDGRRRLPQRQREVVVLRYYLDLSEEQIAAWLGVSTGSVKRHAFRATAALQKRMEAWA
jgi:RNA polymerase sigma-70 factor (sigma-E family)